MDDHFEFFLISINENDYITGFTIQCMMLRNLKSLNYIFLYFI